VSDVEPFGVREPTRGGRGGRSIVVPLNGNVSTVCALARRASPVAHVHPAAPPFHLAHGGRDRFVPAAQSRQLAEALRAAGVEVELTIVPEADHMWLEADDPQAVFAAAVAFARRVTGLG
jgi:dipeptidyl aminopeptidase/acylaminoacyl peptidase